MVVRVSCEYLKATANAVAAAAAADTGLISIRFTVATVGATTSSVGSPYRSTLDGDTCANAAFGVLL